MADIKPEDNNNPADSTANGGENGGEAGTKTFTQEDLDNIVSKRLADAKAKSEESTKAAIREALADAERKAKLSEEERKNEAQKEIENNLAAKERDLAIRENRATAREALAEKGIDTGLVKYLVDQSAEKTEENIEEFAKIWDKSLADAYEKKFNETFKGKTPADLGNGAKKPATTPARPSGIAVF